MTQPTYGQHPGQQPVGQQYPQQAQSGYPGQAPYPGGHPMGTVRLTTQGSMMLSFITPTITIDGASTNNRYGTADIAVPAGPHRVEGQVNYLWTFGRAALDINVPPGGVVPVFYASPVINFLAGNIGHEKQKHAGMVFYIVLLAVAVLLIVGSFAAAFFSAMN